MFRILLKALCLTGLLLAVGGVAWIYQRSRPQVWTLEQALQHVQSTGRQLATIHARPESDHKLYDLKPNEVTRERPTLGATSPAEERRLLGPAAAPRGEWPSLVGTVVQAAARLSVSRDPLLIDSLPRLETAHVMLPMMITPNVMLRDAEPIAGRQILARLDDDLWVLSPSFVAEKGDTSSTLHIGEVEWAEQDVHKGVLYRCKDYPFGKEKFDAIVAKDHRLADAWLIDEGAKVQMTQYTGYHVYAPVEGTVRKIWVQVPLEQEGDWETKAGDDLTGVWLPAGSNAFVPDEPDARPGETAVLQWGDWARSRYLGEETGAVWQGVTFGGAGMALLSGIVLFITAPSTRSKQAAPSSD